MNHIYRVIFNNTAQAQQTANKVANTQGQSIRLNKMACLALAISLSLLSPHALADGGPGGGTSSIGGRDMLSVAGGAGVMGASTYDGGGAGTTGGAGGTGASGGGSSGGGGGAGAYGAVITAVVSGNHVSNNMTGGKGGNGGNGTYVGGGGSGGHGLVLQSGGTLSIHSRISGGAGGKGGKGGNGSGYGGNGGNGIRVYTAGSSLNLTLQSGANIQAGNGVQVALLLAAA